MIDNILVEKYRPEKIDDIVGQKHIKNNFKNFIERKEIPHLLFYGLPGIGKTTTAIALAKEILGEAFYVNFLELNASDTRKIDDVREIIKVYAKQEPMQARYRIILLDEVDSMTTQAQMALKRIMEKNAKNCRFILTCNYVHKLDDAIISRCAEYNFVPVQSEDIVERLIYICKEESIIYETDAIKYIADNSIGDIRRAITKLQSIASFDNINMESIYSDKIEGNFLFLIKSLLKDKNWLVSRQAYFKVRNEGLSERDIILRLHNYIIQNDIVPNEMIGGLARLFRNAEINLLLGTTPQIEIDVLFFEIIDFLSH